jgi:hypothetical protein
MQNLKQNLYTKSISVICGCGKMFNQINLFMRNKPNYRKVEVNISNLITKTYENIPPLSLPKNKAEQSQF